MMLEAAAERQTHESLPLVPRRCAPMDELKVAYSSISTVARCKMKESAAVPFDRRHGTMSAYFNAVLCVAFCCLIRLGS